MKKFSVILAVVTVAAVAAVSMTACGAKQRPQKADTTNASAVATTTAAQDSGEYNTVAPYIEISAQSENNSATVVYNTVAPYNGDNSQNSSQAGGQGSSSQGKTTEKEYNTVAPYEKSAGETVAPSGTNSVEYNTVAPYGG